VELLVVIAIISILAAMLMPALEEAIGQARLVSCANQQRQLGLGMMYYADEHDGALGRPDVGRFPGDSWKSDAAVANSGQFPYSINQHGSWLIGSDLPTELYFCPDLEEQDTGSVLGSVVKRQRVWQESVVRDWFRAGGPTATHPGNAYLCNTLSHVSYVFNHALLPEKTMAATNATTPSSTLRYRLSYANKLGNLTSRHPVLTDYRGSGGAGSLRQHGGRFFTILGGDGHVVTTDLPGFVDAGLNVGELWPQAFEPWMGASELPFYKCSIDDGGWPSWHSQKCNPFRMGQVYNHGGTMYWLAASGLLAGK
jgi:type II secretory pathway pseudopilin PulG